MSISLISGNQKGVFLVTALIFMTILLLLGSTAVMVTTTDIKIGGNYKISSQAFYIAEAGLARAAAEAINDLDDDQDVGNTSFSALFGTITITPDSTAFYTPPGFESFSFGSGSYAIQFKNIGTSPNFSSTTLWVRSTGTGVNSSSAILGKYLSAENISAWNNALFAGGGGGSAPMTGNVDMAGSIHLLGNDQLGNALPSTDIVFSNQSVDLLNTNEDMDSDLADAIDGGTSSDLSAKFRVKNGRVDMNTGSGKIGTSSSPFKGIYVTSGTDSGGDGVNDDIIGGDNDAAGQNIYANKGASSAKEYDLEGHDITMPTIDTASLDASSLDLTGDNEKTIHNVGLDAGDLTLTGKYKVGPTWYYPDIHQAVGGNFIIFDSITNVLTINGIVKVSSLIISDDITYSGQGTIYVTGNTLIDGDVLPDIASSYPTTNVLGVITAGDMTLGSSATQLILTGAYYTAGTATCSKQTELAGTIVSQEFDFTAQVPKIWQVPSLATNLPPGMPGEDPIWVITDQTWREIR